MPIPKSATQNQLSGLKAACGHYNEQAAHADPQPDDENKIVKHSPETYWDFVYSHVQDGRSEEDVFEQATESYQEAFDVGLGTEGIRTRREDREKVRAEVEAEVAGSQLKADYDKTKAVAEAVSKTTIDVTKTVTGVITK